jgi:hypothetical protein
MEIIVQEMKLSEAKVRFIFRQRTPTANHKKHFLIRRNKEMKEREGPGLQAGDESRVLPSPDMSLNKYLTSHRPYDPIYWKRLVVS